MLLTNFHILRPPYETKQEKTLEWLASIHAESEKTKSSSDPSFKTQILEKLWKVGCKPDRILKRGHIVADYLHQNWNEMEVYNLSHSPQGQHLSFRSNVFERYVDQVFETYYPEDAVPPKDLIHVTCTGYVSPSGAQKIVGKRNWRAQTTVTHAYHMGCYGSIPAIRMGQGFLLETRKEVDIVHTEICSLHTDPSNHNTDQLVSQSLFADGFIKYSIQNHSPLPHIQVHAIRQEILPHSTKAMTWTVCDWGFQMSLAKEIPVLIAKALPSFFKALADNASFDEEMLRKSAYFSIHPGGPKILTYIQELFRLEDHQIEHSFAILKNYGNMSSATLPHIWESLLSDPKVADKTKIVSLAFGPGLSITGAIMEKRCGC